jgi:nitrite reductase/ring-hydroxylating ferredoxin subunit
MFAAATESGYDMTPQGLKRNLFQRVFGIPATTLLENASAWSFSDNTIVIDLDRVPELKNPGSGIRLEGNRLPERILVVHGNDDAYHAYRNRCGHGGRRLDPVPDDTTIQCCSVGKTTCDYTGRVLSGSAKKPTQVYRVDAKAGKLTIYLD